MIDEFAKEHLHDHLRWVREALVWKLGGLSEYDIRRPMTSTGTNLRDVLGHELRWRHDDLGQAGLALPGGDTEIVLATRLGYEPDWLVASADEAARVILSAGGKMIAEPSDIPVGRVAVVADPFGNALVLVDLSKGVYVTGEDGRVTGVARGQPGDAR